MERRLVHQAPVTWQHVQPEHLLRPKQKIIFADFALRRVAHIRGRVSRASPSMWMLLLTSKRTKYPRNCPTVVLISLNRALVGRAHWATHGRACAPGVSLGVPSGKHGLAACGVHVTAA